MRADDDVRTKDGSGAEDGIQRFSDGIIRSFTVTADSFCELRTCIDRLVEDFPININRVLPAASRVIYLTLPKRARAPCETSPVS